jgi:hypothetical protein
VKNLYMAKSNLITDKMEINLNMLRALMLYWVAGHVDSADVVAENHRSSMERGVELQQELAKPGSLSHSIGDCMILGLSTRAGDCRLAFGGLGDEVSTEEHCVTRCGFASFGAASPVGIGIDDKIQRWTGAGVGPSARSPECREESASELPNECPEERACGDILAELHKKCSVE